MKVAPQSSAAGLTDTILRAIRGLKYGSLEILVHDEKIVRIEKHERIRIDVDSYESIERHQSSHHR